MREIREKVIDDLKNYRADQDRIQVLRFELDHPKCISDAEMIEMMSFSHGYSSGAYLGQPSTETSDIALTYHDRAEHENDSTRNEILAQFHNLTLKQKRLELYISLLDEKDELILHLIFIDGLKNSDAARKLDISPRAVTYRKKRAINELCKLYIMAENTCMS